MHKFSLSVPKEMYREQYGEYTFDNSMENIHSDNSMENIHSDNSMKNIHSDNSMENIHSDVGFSRVINQ